MVGVVEATYVLGAAGIDEALDEVLDRGIDPIVVLGVVLVGTELIGQTTTLGTSDGERRAVGLVGAEGVGGIHIPGAVLARGDDIDHPADSVSAEVHGDDPSVDLDPLGIAHGDIIEAKGSACSLLRDSIDKDLDVPSAEAVQRDVHIRAHTARLPHLHPGSTAESLAEGLVGGEELTAIYRDRIVGCPPEAGDTPSDDLHTP